MYGLYCAPACQQGKIRETISILKNRPGTLGRLISAITRATIDSSICNFFEFFLLATKSQDTLLFKVRCASPVLSMERNKILSHVNCESVATEKTGDPEMPLPKTEIPGRLQRSEERAWPQPARPL